MRLINFLNRTVKIASHTTIQRKAIQFCYERRELGRNKQNMRKVKISITADACSSTVYKAYIVVTGNWIDTDWELRYSILDFKRGLTPYNCYASCQFIYEVIKEWGIKNLVCIMTDNTSYMISGFRKLNSKLCADLERNDVGIRREL